MPLGFSQIPSHLQLKIVAKCDPPGFVNFSQCSKLSSVLASFLETKITVKVDEIRVCAAIGIIKKYSHKLKWLDHEIQNCPFRFNGKELGIKVELTDTESERIVDMLSRLSATFEGINFGSHVLCCEDNFTRLLQTSGAFRLIIAGDIPSSILHLPIFKTIQNLAIKRDINDEDLLALRSKQMTLSGTFASNGLNTFFKQWLNGTRDIEFVVIATSTPIVTQHMPDVLNGLPHSILWTSETHVGFPKPIECREWIAPYPNIYRLKRGEKSLCLTIGLDIVVAKLESTDLCLYCV